MGVVDFAVGRQVQIMAIVECASVALLLALLGAIAWIAFGAWKDIQAFRERRIQPLLRIGKGLANTGKEMGATCGSRVATIARDGKALAEAVSVRAQTTANVVKGTVPEAQRVPVQATAVTATLRDTLHTARTVRSTVKALQGLRAAVLMVSSASSFVRAARRRPSAGAAEVPAEAAV